MPKIRPALGTEGIISEITQEDIQEAHRRVEHEPITPPRSEGRAPFHRPREHEAARVAKLLSLNRSGRL